MCKKYILTLLASIFILAQLAAQSNVKQYAGEKFNSLDAGIEGKVTATVIYDNYVHDSKMEADWGYSIMLEGLAKTILFDTGTKSEVFRSNFTELDLDAGSIDEVIISHEHGDHFGGLHALLKMNSNLSLVVPETFSGAFIREYSDECDNIEKVNYPVQICNNLYSTGVMGIEIPEQALVLNTKKGLVVMTGCSHPGIIPMLKQIEKTFKSNVYMVFGGFHLMNHSDKQIEKIIQEMKDLGVIRCGATHCTGERQIEQFRKAFGKDFVEMGAGNIITFE